MESAHHDARRAANWKESEHLRRLFAAPLREFTAVRDQLVRELRTKGKADEATSIAKLRKPSVALWIANQLARLALADVEALIEATVRLRHGQSAGVRGASADELREAMRARRNALARLADVAERAGLETGTKLTLALRRRVESTAQAAAANEPESLLKGLLETELQPSGFEGLLGAASPSEREIVQHEIAGRPPRPDEAAARARKKEEAAARAHALRQAEREAHRLDAGAKKLDQRAAAREQEATRARQEADEARRKAGEAAARALALRGG
jgi:hypothetical protein